jgi:hypothetical protein
VVTGDESPGKLAVRYAAYAITDARGGRRRQLPNRQTFFEFGAAGRAPVQF